MYEDVSNRIGKVKGCHVNKLISTCQVLHDAHDEIGQCDARACYQAIVARVKAGLDEVVKNVEVNKLSREVMEPIAATFRTILQLTDMNIRRDLKTFSAIGIAAVPVSFSFYSFMVLYIKKSNFFQTKDSLSDTTKSVDLVDKSNGGQNSLHKLVDRPEDVNRETVIF